VRERRGSYSRCVVGCIPSFFSIIIRKGLEISLVDVAHTGRTTYICVSIVLCIFCVLFPHLFCFIAPRSCFSNTSNKSKSKGILDLIHSYVSGSLSVASLQ
jgi:hypothetical protein